MHSPRQTLALALAVLLASALGACRHAPKSEAALADPPLVARLKQTPTGEHYQARLRQFREENARLAPGGIVFCGDSITEALAAAPAFANEPIINRGISGDGLAGLVQRLELSATGLKPRKLFLMIGINDVVFADYSLADYETLYGHVLGRLRRECPGTQVYVQSILPVKGRFAHANPKVREVNQLLRRLARRHGMTYVDLHAAFADDAGEMRAELSPDGVHPNSAGQALWHEQIRGCLAAGPGAGR